MSLFDNDDRSRLIEQQIEAVKRALGQSGSSGGSANTSTIPTPFEQGLTRGPVNMQGMSDAQTQSLIDQRLDARSFGMDDNIDASRIRDDEGNIADIFRDIFTGMGRSDLLETDGEILQILAETTTAGQPAALPDDDRLTSLSQENMAALLQAILIYNQQLEEQQEVETQTISLEDFQEIYSSNPEDDNYLDPEEYMEDGTWTDPETGIVYVINIPPPVEEEPTEEEPGGGGEEAPTEEEGEPTEEQPEEEEVEVDPTDSTVDDEDAETAETVPPDTIETEEEATPPPFFRVENGQVYVIDYETGRYISVEEHNKKHDWLPERWYEDYLGSDPVDGVYTDNGVLIEDEDIIFDLPPLPEQQDTGIIIPEEEEPIVIFDPIRTPDFPGGPAPIPEQEPEEPTTPTEPTEPVPPVEEVPETPEEPTPPAEEPEQPTEETEPTPTTEQPTEQPTPTEEAPETPEQPGTETPSDTPTTGTDETGTAGEGEGDGTGTGTGTGEGEGEGDGTGTGEKRDGLFDDYKEFMTSIGYQPVQMQQLIAPPKKDYFRELDSLIGRSLFGKMI